MDSQNSLINPEILERLSSDDKSVLLESLATLIQSTYGTEQEFKKLQNDFNNLKALYEWVLELIPQAIWVIESSGEIFYQNAEAVALEGMLPQMLHALNSQKGEIGGEIGGEAQSSEIQSSESQTSGAQIEQEVEFGGHFYLVQSSVKNNMKILSATNITNQKRQERLASMGQVSAHLAHEIRNPIGSISLLTSSLLKRGDSATKPLVLEMKKALWRVERLINATLLFTKGVQPNRQLCQVADFEDDLYNALAYYTYSKKIEFDFRFGVDSEMGLGQGVKADSEKVSESCSQGQILADFDLLSIVLQNFLSNAIDAIEEGECEEGKISVGFYDDGQRHCFSFSDNGKPVEDKNILFEPFKTTKLKGNGLGLALSQQIVQAHGGEICFCEDHDEIQNAPDETQKGKTFLIKIAKN